MFFRVNRIARKILRLAKKEFKQYGQYTLAEIFDEPETFMFGNVEVDMVPYGRRGNKILLDLTVYYSGNLVMAAKNGYLFTKPISFKEGDWEKVLMAA